MSSRECNDLQIADQTTNLNTMDELEIHEGKEFESKEEAFMFYKEYAKSIGFTAIVKASRRSRITGKFIDAKFVCSRCGSKKIDNVEKTKDTTDTFNNISKTRKRGRTNHSSLKTDCKACFHVKRRQDGRWIVRSLIKEHNHETMKLNQEMEVENCSKVKGKQILISALRESGGRKKLEKENGGNKSELSSRKVLALEDGDVESLLKFFADMQEENPFFFYAVDLSEDQRLRNVFWVDAKSRLDYTCFNDVLSVDTTFIKNEYKLPLVCFNGVNHHGQGLVLGSGLLRDESKSGFIWLFRAWLKAMNGQQPRVILTKHDQMIKEAVLEAFPCSRHCFYMWDTLGLMPEKLGKSFLNEISDVIHGSCESDEFEEKFWEVVDKFQIRSNPWIQSLYTDREYWIPVYIKDVSLAGMSTTQRLDSVFDKYIQRKTTLKGYLDQYKRMIHERYEEEEKAEIETLHKQPGLKSPSPFGKQMASMYTSEIFKKFQVEVLGVVACHPKKESEIGVKKTFRVQDYEQNRGYVVVLSSDESSDVVCSCRLFEFNGFLCRHAMIVLQMSGELRIPSKYVLKRWTKEAKTPKNREVIGTEISTVQNKAQRYADLCLRSLKLSEEASLSEESYNAMVNVLDEAFKKCENANLVIQNVEESDPVLAQDHQEDEITFEMNKDVNVSNMEHSLQEVLSIWKAATSQEHSNRYSILDAYLNSQQIPHEMGQMNTIASNRHGYCTIPQDIHSQEQSSFRPEAMSSCFNIHERLQEMLKDTN